MKTPILIFCLFGSLAAQTISGAALNGSSSVVTTAKAAPYISDVRKISITSSAMTITWKTDRASSTQLAYGDTSAYGSLTTETDTGTGVTLHSVTVTGLTGCHSYRFQPISKDATGTGKGPDGTWFTYGCTALANPVPAACQPYNPNDNIHVWSMADITRVRNAAINDIWRTTHVLPTRQPDTITTNTGTTYAYLTTTGMAISTIDKFGIDMDGYHSEAILIHPTSSNNKLAIVHQGHCIGSTANNLNDIGVKETISQLLSEGFYVMAFQMPDCGANTPITAADSTIAHNTIIGALETASFNPFKLYMEPIAVMLNYTSANYSFTQTVMMGISGGGWTTTLYAALDPRITMSFPVSGSQPHGLRSTSCSSPTFPEGDYEQGDQTYGSRGALNFWLNVMTYEDAYIIASSQGRRQVQMLRTSDPCCFAGVRYQDYESTINSVAGQLGGSFAVYNDTASTLHEISPNQRARIATELGY